MNANDSVQAAGLGGAFGDLSQRVIGCALAVSNTLGGGFLESVYENALAVELESRRIPFERQKALIVRYCSVEVGHFYADLVIDGRLLVELKALRQLTAEHEAQVMNDLRATDLRVGLLLNFGAPRLGVRRVVWGYQDDSTI
jgi:GxxExxY protein